MSYGSVRVRTAAITGGSGDGGSRRPGVPGAALALAGWFGRAGRNWWCACASIACEGPLRDPRVRGGVQQEGPAARHRESGEFEKSGAGLRIASARCDGSLLPLASESASAAPARARHSRTSRSADRPRGRLSPRPLRRVLAAGAALCAAGLALALAGATPAQAQSNATTRIWSADMTVGENQAGTSAGVFVGSDGTLSDTTFTFKGVEHTVTNLEEVEETISFLISPGFGTSRNQADVTAYIEDLRWSMTQGSTSYGYNFDDREPTVANVNTYFFFADTTRSWSSGDDIEVRLTTRAPSAPTDVRAQAGARSVSLTWDVPDTNGGGISAQRGIYRYELRYKVGSGSYGDWQTVPGGGSARSHTLTDLEGGVGHAFQLRARNDYGSNMYSDAVLATPLKVPEIAGVSMVSNPLQGDTYGRGETIEFEVAFDEPVVIRGGSLHASLFVGAGSGGTERRADYVPATDTSAPRTLRFLYTVQESDADSDGATVGANALAVGGAPDGSPKGGGTIQSSVEIGTGLDADLSSDSMSFPNHKVDGSVLLVEPPGVTKIAISSAAANGAFFTDGEEILIDVDFADTVTVSGDEVSLALNIGGGSQTASFVQVVEITSAQVNIHRLVFAYIVQPGDVDSNGIRVPANALAVSGTTAVRDRYDRDAVLTHAAFEFPNYLVNPPPPGITNIEIVSDVPDHGFHSSALGDVVEFRVTFSEAVTASGNLALFEFAVRVGDDDVLAPYIEGSGTTQLTFILDYGAQHTDPDGVSVPAGSLHLGTGGTLRDAYGRDVTLTHGAYAFPQHLVNTLPPPPQITGIRIVSEVPDAGFYAPVRGAPDRVRGDVQLGRDLRRDQWRFRSEGLDRRNREGCLSFFGVWHEQAPIRAQRAVERRGPGRRERAGRQPGADGGRNAQGRVRPGRGADPRRLRVSAAPREQRAAPAANHRHSDRVGGARCRVLRAGEGRRPDRVRGDVQLGRDLRRDQWRFRSEGLDRRNREGCLSFFGVWHEQAPIRAQRAVERRGPGRRERAGRQPGADGGRNAQGPLRPGRRPDPWRLRPVPPRPGELRGGPAVGAAQPGGDGGQRERGAVPVGPAGR